MRSIIDWGIDWSASVLARHERAARTEKSQRGRWRSSLLLAFIAAVALALTYPGSSGAQSQQRSGAHSRTTRETFTPADRRLVERAIGATCAERIRDPQGSTPIDEMQARPSLPVNNTEALAGARRAERLLPATRKLVISAIVQLAKDYDLYESSISRARINSATV